MYSLPQEIQRCIYEFDPTYKIIYKQVIEDIKPIHYHIMKIFLENDFEEFEFSDLSSNRFTFGKNGEIYDEVVIFTEDEMKNYLRNELVNYLYYLEYNDIIPFLRDHVIFTEELYNGITNKRSGNRTIDASNFIGSLLTNVNDCITTALTEDRLLHFGNCNGCFERIICKNKTYFVQYENI